MYVQRSLSPHVYFCASCNIWTMSTPGFWQWNLLITFQELTEGSDLLFKNCLLLVSSSEFHLTSIGVWFLWNLDWSKSIFQSGDVICTMMFFFLLLVNGLGNLRDYHSALNSLFNMFLHFNSPSDNLQMVVPFNTHSWLYLLNRSSWQMQSNHTAWRQQ